MTRDAILSEDRIYRYALYRDWGTERKLCFVMLNPSIADENVDDPTVRLCMAWAKNLGFDSIVIVNLFAWRATNPQELVRQLAKGTDIVGSENDSRILVNTLVSDMVICAWGNNGNLEGRASKVLHDLKQHGVSPYCLKLSKGGHPVHPLYQPYSLVPKRMDSELVAV